ncbi:MAG: hypothetical protein GWN58_56795 [Anaerolineae bacterium]|nr:hypothetical protein [Anaerolineae bacterium]
MADLYLGTIDLALVELASNRNVEAIGIWLAKYQETTLCTHEHEGSIQDRFQ